MLQTFNLLSSSASAVELVFLKIVKGTLLYMDFIQMYFKTLYIHVNIYSAWACKNNDNNNNNYTNEFIYLFITL